MKTKGGKVIASGGFGCVFKGALKCKDSKFREKNKISKLMTEKHALSEFNEIQEIKNKIDQIKGYKKYFLVDNFTLCTPDKLTISDLQDFKKKCTALPKDNITEKNINDSLDKLKLLNMPDGGIPVDDFVYDNSTFEKLYELNKSLISLLVNGIIPMNKLNIYHCDIKDSNVLVDDRYNIKNLYTRLIDWGLSTEYVPFINQKFPKTWRNRPLQFNVPFSVILFTDKFIISYKNFIDNNETITEENIRPFVENYIKFWMKERGIGHYKFINELMGILFFDQLKNFSKKNRAKIVEENITMKYITNYLVSILLNYTYIKDDGNINIRPYLDEVFINIVDIWGFILVYYPILEFLYNNYDILDDNQLKIFNLLKTIYIHYLYEPRIKPININNLVDDLEYLGYLFKEEFTEKNKLKATKLTKTGVTGNTFIPNSMNKNIKKTINKSLKMRKNTTLSINDNKNKLIFKNIQKTRTNKKNKNN